MKYKEFYQEKYNIYYNQEYCKQAILHYPPLWVTLGIISACSYRCAFCAYHSLDARKISKVYNVRYTMPLNEAKKLIDFIYIGDAQRIHICGTGEPLLHPDFFSIIDYVIERYGHVSFQSNLSLKIVEQCDAINEIKKRESKISSITTDFLGNNAVKYGGNNEELYYVISKLSGMALPPIHCNFLLTKSNISDLKTAVLDAARYKLRVYISVNPVFAYNMNEFTSTANTWRTDDLEMKIRLDEITRLASSLGVRIGIYAPASLDKIFCDVFWKKFQLWPTKESSPGRLDNMIPHACNAVVSGTMFSLGYLQDYPNLISAWNSEKLVTIRHDLLNNIYPDRHCENCFLCPGLTNAEKIKIRSRIHK